MKVAIIEPVGGHGGMNYYDFSLSEALVKKGNDVYLYTCDETILVDSLLFKCITSFKGIYGANNKYVRGFRFLIGLFRSLMSARSYGCRVVHFHFFHTTPLEWLMVNLAKKTAFKVVITVHDVESFAEAGLMTSAYSVFGAADRVIVHNKVSFDELVNKVGIDPAIIRIVAHGNYITDRHIIHESMKSRKQLDLPLEKKILLFFGQIKQVKGLEILLEAMRYVVSKRQDVLLVIAGKVWKDDFSAYQMLIDKYELTPYVKLDIAYITDERADLYYSASDIVVLPYKRIYQSGVLLMAMSLGKVVIASNLPGMMEVVEDHQNGFLFETENPQSLAEKIVEVLNNPILCNVIADAAIRHMREYYSWSGIAEKVEDVYREALK